MPSPKLSPNSQLHFMGSPNQGWQADQLILSQYWIQINVKTTYKSLCQEHAIEYIFCPYHKMQQLRVIVQGKVGSPGMHLLEQRRGGPVQSSVSFPSQKCCLSLQIHLDDWLPRVTEENPSHLLMSSTR